jgi:hypothetical protein
MGSTQQQKSNVTEGFHDHDSGRNDYAKLAFTVSKESVLDMVIEIARSGHLFSVVPSSIFKGVCVV